MAIACQTLLLDLSTVRVSLAAAVDNFCALKLNEVDYDYQGYQQLLDVAHLALDQHLYPGFVQLIRLHYVVDQVSRLFQKKHEFVDWGVSRTLPCEGRLFFVC